MLPAAATHGALAGRYSYVDEARTHAVEAHALPDALAIHERDLRQNASWATRLPARDAWEVRLHLAELEARLAASGRYWRRGPASPGWTPLPLHPAFQRPHAAGLAFPEAGLELHPFRRPGRARFVLAKRTLPGRRLLAALEYPEAQPDAGVLALLHAALPDAGVPSLVAREHLLAQREGFERLARPQELVLAFGSAWRDVLLGHARRMLEGLRAGRIPEAATPSDHEPAPAPGEIARLLRDPRLRALEARHLREGEADALLRGGEPAVRRAVAQRRRQAGASEQARLSLLEAALLARLRVDPEATRILRRMDYYL